MKTCWAIILCLAIGAYFTLQWYWAMQTYLTERDTITATLEAQGLLDVKVFPKTKGCYSYNATDVNRYVHGKICMESDDE